MRSREEIEKFLREFPERTKPNPDLAQDAARLAEQLYQKPARKPRRLSWWKIGAIISACCACVLTAVLVPVYSLRTPPELPPIINSYTDEDLRTENVRNIEELISSHHFSFHYLPSAQQNYIQRVVKTEQIVIISQQYFYFDENNYDIVNLDICLTKDEFVEFEKYHNFQTQRNISGIDVQYKLRQSVDGCEILAKCEVDSVRYFWTINALQGEERLDYYIGYLFGGA